MKGTNTLKLNQDTMREAMQVWIDATFASADKPKVTNVKAADSTAYGQANEFEVMVSAEQPKP